MQEFRDRRPVVIETGENERDYKWLIEGETFRIGGSPSSKDAALSRWSTKRCPNGVARTRSGEFHSAQASPRGHGCRRYADFGQLSDAAPAMAGREGPQSLIRR